MEEDSCNIGEEILTATPQIVLVYTMQPNCR